MLFWYRAEKHRIFLTHFVNRYDFVREGLVCRISRIFCLNQRSLFAPFADHEEKPFFAVICVKMLPATAAVYVCISRKKISPVPFSAKHGMTQLVVSCSTGHHSTSCIQNSRRQSEQKVLGHSDRRDATRLHGLISMAPTNNFASGHCSKNTSCRVLHGCSRDHCSTSVTVFSKSLMALSHLSP